MFSPFCIFTMIFVSWILRMSKILGAFNKFPDIFVQVSKIVVDSWNFSMLLLNILWDDWPRGANEQLKQELEYTLVKPAGQF